MGDTKLSLNKTFEEVGNLVNEWPRPAISDGSGTDYLSPNSLLVRCSARISSGPFEADNTVHDWFLLV